MLNMYVFFTKIRENTKKNVRLTKIRLQHYSILITSRKFGHMIMRVVSSNKQFGLHYTKYTTLCKFNGKISA